MFRFPKKIAISAALLLCVAISAADLVNVPLPKCVGPVMVTPLELPSKKDGGAALEFKPSNVGVLMMVKNRDYDAEVEYLESTGTQWIDTGVVYQNNYNIDCNFACSVTGTASRFIFGVYGSGFNRQVAASTYSNWSTASAGLYLYKGSLHTGVANNAVNNVRLRGMQWNYNGTDYDSPWTFNATEGLTMYLFAGNYVGTASYFFTGRIYSFKIWDANGVLVRDYIPVRVGTVGYLYDRVSGQLYGNAGTGAFIVGPDIVPVEYIESHGTEYIDTGLLMNINNYQAGVDAEIDASFSSMPYVGQAIFKNKTCYFFLGVNASGKYYSGMRKEYAASNISNDGARHTFNLSSATNQFSIDGIVVTHHSDQNPTVDEPSNILLFAVSNPSTSPSYYASMRCYGCVFKYSNSPVRKFTPVRVGTEGAMMDTLTRSIYRNAGSGSFSYGSDLPYPIGGR